MIKNKRRCKTIVHTFVQLASLFPAAKRSEENYITFPSRENISSKFKVAHQKNADCLFRVLWFHGRGQENNTENKSGLRHSRGWSGASA